LRVTFKTAVNPANAAFWEDKTLALGARESGPDHVR